MLKQVTFKTWKSFEEATLYIDPFTALIGTNASGKSNVLDGLELLRRMAMGVDIESAFKGTSVSQEGMSALRGGLAWSALQPGHQVSIKAVIQDESPDREYAYELTLKTAPKPAEILDERLTTLTYANESDQAVDTTTIIGGAGQSPAVAPHSHMSTLSKRTLDPTIPDSIALVSRTLRNIFILDPIPSQMRSYTPLSDTLLSNASNLAGVLAKLPPDRKNAVEHSLATYASRLPEGDIQRVWAEPVGRLETDAMLYCEERWPSEQAPMLIDARSMSDGTLHFLAVLTAMLTRPEKSLIAIEDVDRGLHPSRVRFLLQTLREIGQQRAIDVLVTTHNPAFLDALEPDLIPFMTLVHRHHETGHSTLTLLEQVEQLPKLLASGSPGQLAERGAFERGVRTVQERGAE
jgi:predicted ATPase